MTVFLVIFFHVRVDVDELSKRCLDTNPFENTKEKHRFQNILLTCGQHLNCTREVLEMP